MWHIANACHVQGDSAGIGSRIRTWWLVLHEEVAYEGRGGRWSKLMMYCSTAHSFDEHLPGDRVTNVFSGPQAGGRDSGWFASCVPALLVLR